MAKGKTAHKVRTDNVLRNLPEERQKEICDRMDTEPAVEVQAWLLKEDGLKISCRALYALAAYWRSEARYSKAWATRDVLLEHLLERRPERNAVEVAAAADAIFLAELIERQDLDGFVKLRTVMERARQTTQDERKLAMLEEKERKLREVEEALKKRQTAGGLSSETLEVIESTLGMILKQA